MTDRGRLGEYPFDHAVIAGRELEPLVDAFVEFGMDPEYGGEHAHDVTHNSLLGFDDGSYLELLSTTDPGRTPGKRASFIAGDAGPCGWALEADDVEAVVSEMTERGVTAELSPDHERRTPDGEVAAWQLAYLGEGDPGTELPFVIEDRSPRENRIAPSPSVAGSELVGVGAVVIGVADLDAAVERYRRAFDLPEPKREVDPGFGAELALLEGGVAVLAAPLGDGWLADRVERFGTLPCGVLIASRDVGTTIERFGAVEEAEWFGRRVGWTAFGAADGRIGVIEG